MMLPAQSDPAGPRSDMYHSTNQDQRSRKTWMAITYDESSGEFLEESSQNMVPFRSEILQEAKAKFQERVKNDMLQIKSEEQSSVSRSQPKMSRRAGQSGDSGDAEDGSKRSRSATIQLETAKEPVPRPRKAGKVVSKSSIRNRESASLNTSFSSQVEHDDITGEKVVQYRVTAIKEWEEWMYNALCALQQLGCRTMAKEWIKAIHPKKQSTNPYNGRNPKTGDKGNPDDIKPVYWPKDVKHREPDHIQKDERLKLLVHLLMNTPHKLQAPVSDDQIAKEIGAQALMNALHGKFDNAKYGLKNKKSIVQKMIEVRTYLEQYKEGGLSESTVLGAPDYTNARRNSKYDDDEADEEIEGVLDVIPDYGEYNGDNANAPAPTNTEPSPIRTVIAELPGELTEKSDELRIRTKGRRRAKRPPARNNTDPMSGRTYASWGPPMLPPGYGMPVPQMPGYDGLARHTTDSNGVPMVQQIHHPMSWDPMSGPMNYPTHFHDPELAGHRIVPNMNVDPSHFMSREYAMMPQQQFCGGQHPYFQSSPTGANMPFQYDPSPMQGFDQAAHAYFPSSSQTM